MEKLLISACLLGVSCRYDGKSKPLPEAEKLFEKYELIPVCAEIFGGLPTPRVPAEISGEKVKKDLPFSSTSIILLFMGVP